MLKDKQCFFLGIFLILVSCLFYLCPMLGIPTKMSLIGVEMNYWTIGWITGIGTGLMLCSLKEKTKGD